MIKNMYEGLQLM